MLGWRLTRWTTLRAEYTLQDLRLVDGASGALGDPDRRSHFVAFSLGVHF